MSIPLDNKSVDIKTLVLAFLKLNIACSLSAGVISPCINETGKFSLEETKETGSKISKVVDKKILKGKKTQLNLLDGRNYLSETKCNTNDSVSVDFESKKIIKCLPLKEKASVLVFAGKHVGSVGTVNKITEKMVELNLGKQNANVLIKQLMVVA